MTDFHNKLVANDEATMYRKYAQAHKDARAAYETIGSTDEPNASILQVLRYLSKVEFLDINADWYKYLIDYPTCMRMDIDTLKYAEKRLDDLRIYLKYHGVLNDDGTYNV